eukprot:m.4300 g.4300  ORF g.4300 m.4300 type:complete len:239 (-) comp6843_c0_seq1:63-779(-)
MLKPVMSGPYRNDRRDSDWRGPRPHASVWKKHHDEDGTPYWYHTETRETTWYDPSARQRSPEPRRQSSYRDDRRSSHPGRQDSTPRRSISARPAVMRHPSSQPAQRSSSATRPPATARPPTALPPPTVSRQSSARRSREFAPESQRSDVPDRTISAPPSAASRRASTKYPSDAMVKPSSPTKPKEGPTDFELLLGFVFDARKAAATSFRADLELKIVDTRLNVLDHRLDQLNEALLDY